MYKRVTALSGTGIIAAFPGLAGSPLEGLTGGRNTVRVQGGSSFVVSLCSSDARSAVFPACAREAGLSVWISG